MKFTRRKGIEPVVAMLVLLIVSAIAGIAIYSFFTGAFGALSSNTSSPGKFVITAVAVDGNHTNIAINNIGQNNITIPVRGLMVLIDGELKCTGSVTGGSPVTIEARHSAVVSFYFDSAPPAPGLWVIKVISGDGASAAEKVKVSPSAELVVTLSNDASNPARSEDEKAVYKAWQVSSGSNYIIHVDIIFKNGPWIPLHGWVYGELFDKDGQ